MSDPPHKPRDDELEELDGVILAQETSVHAPQPRTQVATDARSVVITEHPPQDAGKRATVRTRRESSEKTVVIRDRRQLDKMRKAISEREQLKHKKPLVEARTIYLLAAAAVASLVVGTLIAALVDSQQEPQLELKSAVVETAAPSASGTEAPPDTIDLDSLPLDKAKRRVSR